MGKLHLTITNSELETFRNCPAKWGFKYVEGLRPKVRKKALALGTTFHDGVGAGLRTWKDSREETLPDRIEVAKMAGHVAAKATYNRYLNEVLRGSEMDADEMEELAEDAERTHELADWMVRFHLHATRYDFERMVPVAIEQPFEVPVPDAKGRPSHLWFAGVWDAVWYDPAMHQLVLQEHKSSSSNPSAMETGLEFDPQIAAYLHAIRWHNRHRGFYWPTDGTRIPLDASVGRVQYNVVKKKVPSQPHVNKGGDVSAKAIDTLAEVYEAALVQQEEQRGIARSQKQIDKLEELRGRGHTSFFGRFEYHHSPKEIERWRVEAYVDGRRMREARRRAHMRTRNPGHCTKAWSMPCEMRPVCIEPDDDLVREAEFRIAETPHEEVAAARREGTDGRQE